MTIAFKVLSAVLGGISIIGIVIIKALTGKVSKLEGTIGTLTTENAAQDKTISTLKTAQSYMQAAKERQDAIAKEGKDYADKVHTGDIDIDDLFADFNDGV